MPDAKVLPTELQGLNRGERPIDYPAQGNLYNSRYRIMSQLADGKLGHIEMREKTQLSCYQVTGHSTVVAA